MNVLTVEDDPVARSVLRSALVQLGHQVTEAHDGEQAWDILRRDGQRVVVSDWRMQRLDGLGLCQRVRSRPSLEYVYFILLTSADESVGNRRLAAEAGVDDFLTKPVDPGLLWVRLRVAERILRYTTQLHRLESMLPMCSYCKKIRDDRNYWQQIEGYINEHTGKEISHSVCPDCYTKIVLPELESLGDPAADVKTKP